VYLSITAGKVGGGIAIGIIVRLSRG